MTTNRDWRTPILCMCFSLFLTDVSARAESYVAGQFGLTFPNTFNHVSQQGATISNLELQNSVMYGAKMGHYLDKLKYFGVETEAYTSMPSIKQQAVASNGIPMGTQSGTHLRVTTWAFNLVYRYPGEIVQPYAGVGVGVFFARASDADGSSLSVSPGLNALAGLRVFVTKQMALFGEYKFNSARLHFKDSASYPSGHYSDNLLAFGVGYHF